jgi:ribulose-5-phosphate 4-epimerase/fuculose-1-phosphate aldolase
MINDYAIETKQRDFGASLRRYLAASFRWAARLGFHEGVANHFSVAVSDGEFLINPSSRHFSRIKASDLILVAANEASEGERADVERTALALHGAVHRRVPHARCVLHVHSKFATVLACLKDSTIHPIDQNTMRFYERVATDDGFNGMGLGEEAERIAGRFGDKSVLIMGNHGVMVVGPTVGRAFDELYYLERACETLVTAYATGRELRIVSEAVAQKTAEQWTHYADFSENHFQELVAILDEEEPEYAL